MPPRAALVRTALTVSAAVAFAAHAARAQDAGPEIPLVGGLAFVTTLHEPDGDRETVVTVEESAAAGVRYAWRNLEVSPKGDTTRTEFTRVVSAADLAEAPRLHGWWQSDGPLEHPGYTAWSLSTAMYRQVRSGGRAAFSIMSAEPPGGGRTALADFGVARMGGVRWVPIRYRGTLAAASPNPEPFPLIVDGRRVTVSALRLSGDFTARGGRVRDQYELWVLADSAHPLLLKWVSRGGANVVQTVRVERPQPRPAALASLERVLGAECRAELPGLYFAFGTAVLDPASDRALAAIAAVIGRHPEWRFEIEGHTDSIGTTTANQTLSERRAESVRTRLLAGHGVPAGALRTAGYGASRPRETNATVEGRARNRRVELVRECAGRASDGGIP